MNLKIEKRRDLTLIKIGGNQTMVIACDSCGGIGNKEHDLLKTPSSVVGAYTSRVIIMEIMASGADIAAICNAVCNEMEPTGKGIIKGIQNEMALAGIMPEVLTGSTEENFVTQMTGVGITGIGICQSDKLKFQPIVKGDRIVLAGRPAVGQEILDNPDLPVSYDILKRLIEDRNVREIVPVGSKGIAYESEILGSLSKKKAVFYETGVDIHKSSGPATCLIAAVSKDFVISGDMVFIGEYY